jgi:DNA modification methylase
MTETTAGGAATMDYAAFLASKRLAAPASGIDVPAAAIHPALFGFQRDLTRWALRKGRAALFADAGLGKTFMQLEWARLLGVPTLIVAPLSVARQTVGEARKIDLAVTYARSPGDVAGDLTITNYEMVERFDPARFGAVVVDESSILKSLDGKTRGRLTAMFADTPHRLCCSATPAPNDIAEIANHAEFLGVMTRVEMLAMFFVHDDDGWRLKRHAAAAFYRWLASWGMSLRRPSDLGYPDDGYALPPLRVTPEWVPADYRPPGQLFFTGLRGIGDRAKVRRGTLPARVARAAEIVNADTERWLVWHGLNDEGAALREAIPGSVLVEGHQSPDEKAAAFEAFQDGSFRVLVTKPKIAARGMNFQQSRRQCWVGLTDSWEDFYQGVRRQLRYGQRGEVDVRIVLSDAEEAIYRNVMRKDGEARAMGDELLAAVREVERDELAAAAPDGDDYRTGEVGGRDWRLLLGDSAERLAEIPDASIDLSVYSPPFQSLYTYSPIARDLGNSRTPEEFWAHYGYLIDHLLRTTKPGRNTCAHVAEIPAMLGRDGYIGLRDFGGDLVRAYAARGWVFHGEVCIDKDPQAQAIRTHSKALLFAQLHKDSSWCRPALADYILIFRKPGKNATPIVPDLSNDEWIEWARPIWYGIRESDTLQVARGRDADDERHIAPLQLETIRRCIRLWSNRGETVLSPFAGIGSEGHEAVRLGRRFVGVELKPSYFAEAARNLRRAEAEVERPTLFDLPGWSGAAAKG